MHRVKRSCRRSGRSARTVLTLPRRSRPKRCNAWPSRASRCVRLGLAMRCSALAEPSLTQRELDVLQLVAQGRSNKDIARRLAITEGTAKTHVKAILTKLDAIS